MEHITYQIDISKKKQNRPNKNPQSQTQKNIKHIAPKKSPSPKKHHQKNIAQLTARRVRVHLVISKAAIHSWPVGTQGKISSGDLRLTNLDLFGIVIILYFDDLFLWLTNFDL